VSTSAAAAGLPLPRVGVSDTGPRAAGWSNLTPLWDPGDRSPPRENASAAYYPPIFSVVRFGGDVAGGAPVNDTWLYIPSELEWRSLGSVSSAKSTAAPPALKDAGLVYDSVDGYLLLFGGTLSNGTPYAGTWVFKGADWANLTWARLPIGPTASPDPTGHPLLSFDPALGAAVLGDPAGNGSMWEFQAGAWARMAAVLPTVAVGSAAIAYDWGSQALTLVGESAGSGGNYATWTFSGGTWSPLATSGSPSAGVTGGLVWDAILQSLLLVVTSPAVIVWSLAGTSWTTNSSADALAPSPRVGATIQYDPWGEFLLLWGGVSDSGLLISDVWGWYAPDLAPPNTSGPGLVPIPPFLEGIAIVLVAIPLAILAYLYLRPRRPTPARSRVPAPSPA
ncbi:MAG: hypothetical protein L3J96_04300, partial [Thermoplasmata archaeon]|nr:hypothetical protein [Thermoplasmata archaeon]